ncbi:MAG: hypothetical protein J6M95_00575 [Bacilli bacterium]|nr:hypothetical protein [Bacilli bacterium]
MPTNKKTIQYFFNQIFNGGNLIKLIVPFTKIKKLDELYKVERNKYVSFEDFENAFPNEFTEYKKSKSAYKEIKKQFENRMGLQPCILTECFVAQTLANHLHLDKYVDLDDSTVSVPGQLTGAIFSAQGYSDGSKFRYCYYNNHYDALVFQCGASGTVDIVFTKFNVSIRIEIKEQVSKLEECDITGLYDERGRLLISNDFRQKRSKYVPFVVLFNALTNVFAMEGHNFNFASYLNDNKAKDIIADALDIKVVDCFVLVVGDKLVPTQSKYLFDFVTFEGSEIRTAGRNYGKVFTPEFARQKINSLGGTIDSDGEVSLPYDPNNRVKGRNLNEYTRYNIGSLLFVKLEDTQIYNNEIKFQFSNMYQKKPSISIHLNAKENGASLNSQYFELNDIFH